MVECFVCAFNFPSPKELISHIKDSHQLSGKNAYCCTICRSQFTEMWKYQRHLVLCFKRVPASEVKENIEAIKANTTQQNLLGFERMVNEKSLKFICNLASNMSIPRNYVYEIVRDFQIFYSGILLEGFSEFVKPFVFNNEKSNAEYFIHICEDPFRKVKTENNLDSELKECGVLHSLKSFAITDDKEEVENDSGVLMPLAFQFKKFFELPGIFKLTQNYANEVLKDSNINHFINAEVWRNKMKSFNPNDIVIPFHIYIDETQVNNALGTHRSDGLETCTYYSFPTIPPQYSSRLENIFVAQLFSSGATKKFGNFECYGELIEALNKLAREPVTLNVDGKDEQVYFVFGLLLGDNKGVNDASGYAKSHSANHFCRFCRMHKKETHTSTIQNDAMMRNESNYEEDVQRKNLSLTGVGELSIVNLIEYTHVTNSVGVDIMHDIYEGILHYNLSEIILRFANQGYISLDKLNELKAALQYGELEAGNKSPPITLERLQSRKLLMSSSEMQCFAHHFGLIVGDFIPKDDSAWKFYLQILKFLDLLYLPSYSENDLKILAETIDTMHQTYKSVFNKTLKPKHHITTHYPTLIRRYGPLYYISSIRYEAKHKDMKNYCKNIACRINLSLSLARKIRYNFASRLLKNIGLNDNLCFGSSELINLNFCDALQRMEMSQPLQYLLKENTKTTANVTINGIKFSDKLYVTKLNDNKLELHRILSIVYVTKTIPDVFFLCETYTNIIFNEQYQCYELINFQSEYNLKLISAVEALHERKYPVTLHQMNDGVNRFRIKYF